MDYHQLYLQLTKQLPDIEIFENHPLAPYTTLKIGGPADIFVHPTNSYQFKSILNFVHQNNLPITILGGGSNVLISDASIRGLVVKNSSSYIKLLPTGLIKVSSGTTLASLIDWSLDNGFVGLEQFAYIPGTVGGAIFSNIHGVDKSNFSQYLDLIKVFNLKIGKIEKLSAADLKWDYDFSPFQQQPHLIILLATLKIPTGDTSAAQSQAQEIIAAKSAVQPMNSAGCVFQNPPNQSAGKIIDDLGFKGRSIGGAQVSPLHANFIVNTGSATALDYLTLAKLIQTETKSRLALDLKFEIKLLGEF